MYSLLFPLHFSSFISAGVVWIGGCLKSMASEKNVSQYEMESDWMNSTSRVMSRIQCDYMLQVTKLWSDLFHSP